MMTFTNAAPYPLNSSSSTNKGFIIVAFDAVGGFFAVNGGGIGGVNPGHVAYFAPESLQWENLGVSKLT